MPTGRELGLGGSLEVRSSFVPSFGSFSWPSCSLQVSQGLRDSCGFVLGLLKGLRLRSLRAFGLERLYLLE